MKIKGMDSWLDRIDKLKRDFPRETGNFLMKEAEIVVGDTKEETPVDTGTLRNSWFRETRKGLTARKVFQQIVYNNTAYVNHVEYGHRIVRNKKTIGFVRGRRMLHKAILKRNLYFYKDLDKLVKKLME